MEAADVLQEPKKKGSRASRSIALVKIILHQLTDELEETEESRPQKRIEKKKRRLRKKAPALVHTTISSVQSDDTDIQDVDTYHETEDEARTIFKEENKILNWDTRTEPFSECAALTTNIVVPKIGLLYPSVTIEKIRDWCLLLELNEDTTDLVIMGRSVVGEIEAIAQLNMFEYFGMNILTEDIVKKSVRTEAL